MRCEQGIVEFIDMLSPEDVLSYPMNPYALRTCAVGASCHVLTDLKLNIVEFSVFRYTISWYITNYKFLVHYTFLPSSIASFLLLSTQLTMKCPH